MTDDICRRLAEPFDPAIVSWRVGPTNQNKSKGMALAYIDARDVMRRLDEVCGPENWQNDYPWSDGKRVVCRIGIKIGDEWIWKTDGAGDTDTEGEKGALSDAFKRSAVHWGIGRYLYDVKSPWVEIEQKGRSYIIPDRELSRLATMLPRAGKPAGERSAAPPPQRPQPVNGHAAPTSAPPPPPNPEEPPEVAEKRRAALAHFWTRNDYGIDPAVIQGGIGRWDAEFLALAEAAPNLDALLKLKEDNKTAGFVKTWESQVASPVIKRLRERTQAAEKRLNTELAA
jgi:hypothetical protein